MTKHKSLAPCTSQCPSSLPRYSFLPLVLSVLLMILFHNVLIPLCKYPDLSPLNNIYLFHALKGKVAPVLAAPILILIMQHTSQLLPSLYCLSEFCWSPSDRSTILLLMIILFAYLVVCFGLHFRSDKLRSNCERQMHLLPPTIILRNYQL